MPRVYLTEGSGAVLGANFMQDHSVIFDEENRRVGFARADCSYSHLVQGSSNTALPLPSVAPAPFAAAAAVAAPAPAAASSSSSPSSSSSSSSTAANASSSARSLFNVAGQRFDASTKGVPSLLAAAASALLLLALATAHRRGRHSSYGSSGGSATTSWPFWGGATGEKQDRAGLVGGLIGGGIRGRPLPGP